MHYAIDGTTTINNVLPLIKYNLNDVKFQAHIIEVCISVHQVLTQRARNSGTAIAFLISLFMHGRIH